MSANSDSIVGQHVQVLLVDDDAARTSNAIVDLGIQIDVADNGEQAVGLLIERPYSAVVISLGISGIDGETTVAMMRGIGFCGPIIGLAEGGIDGDLARYVLAGCTACLRMPLELHSLASILAKYLRLEEARTEDAFALEDMPEFQELKHSFERQLPVRLADLQRMLEGAQWEDALHVAHTIKGQAGTFSYQGISGVANRIQLALIAGLGPDALAAAAELLQLDEIKTISEQERMI